ncbi:MAG: TetR/AcrR family transcriptional regulator [Rhodospirillaceae bacterium]|nr:TetR/AcrR family transcriptional regulator [Rhodospirillaceae bacterium]MCY4239714.1 TetR/AcrR family transcriptional regulator [Rhodospirillaceae bacterium]
MARSRSFATADVLDKAKGVFWTKGYEGASINDLAKATGLKAGSLYNAFGDKKQLYLKSLDRYGEKEVASAIAWMNKQNCRGAEAIARFLDMIASQVASGAYKTGCFLCNAATDQAADDVDIAARVSANIAPLRQTFLHLLQSDPRTADASIVLADFALANYLGMFVMIRGGADEATVRRAISVVTAALSV